MSDDITIQVESENQDVYIDVIQEGGNVGGIDTSAFYLKSNPSGFITGVDLSNYNLLYTIGNQIKSGRLIIGDDAASIVDPNSQYTLSLQTNSPYTWLEILNNSGTNQGAFFGMAYNDFEQYNWQGGDIKFFTSQNPSAGTERLRITNSGNIGIGTSYPSEKLEVAGNIKVTGNVQSNSATFNVRPTVNGTGVLLSGEATSLPDTIVYTTGNQIINGEKNFNNGIIISSQNGGYTQFTSPSNGTNPIVKFLVNDSFSTLGVNIDPFGQIMHFDNGGPSLQLDGQSLVLQYGNNFFQINALESKIANNFSSYQLKSGVNGYIPVDSEVVYNTGDQTISDIKNFTSRPTVNGTGIVLNGEVSTILSGVLYSAEVAVKNDNGSTIYKGQPVYISRAQGSNILVKLASNTGESTSSKTFGLVNQSSLAQNVQGTVITEGLLQGFNTSQAENEGDPIWLGTTGNLIFGLTNKPQAPNHLVYLGVVTRKHATEGEIFVHIQNGFEVRELHDARIINEQNKDVIRYNSDSGLWLNSQLKASDISDSTTEGRTILTGTNWIFPTTLPRNSNNLPTGALWIDTSAGNVLKIVL